jgi:hypothetical protein
LIGCLGVHPCQWQRKQATTPKQSQHQQRATKQADSEKWKEMIKMETHMEMEDKN